MRTTERPVIRAGARVYASDGIAVGDRHGGERRLLRRGRKRRLPVRLLHPDPGGRPRVREARRPRRVHRRGAGERVGPRAGAPSVIRVVLLGPGRLRPLSARPFANEPTRLSTGPGVRTVRHRSRPVVRAPSSLGEVSMAFWTRMWRITETAQETCRRCGGPLPVIPGRRRFFAGPPVCPQCALRARWAASPERRRV